MHRCGRTLASIALLVVGIAYATCPAWAGPASDRIARLNEVFGAVMQNAETLGYGGRRAKLEPALDEAYDFGAMARVTTGRYWRSFSDEQKQQVTAAFRDLSVATYAARFSSSSGARFEIVGEEPAPGETMRVNSEVVRSNGERIRIDYLLRRTAGQWRIIDVYLKSSVSELAVRRDEFTSVLAKSGFDGLIAGIKDKVAALQASRQS